uniref:Uncharacterized protein n=1 Tax=Pipistrellus kuhlii TaxID=59472 RepID=A0A7J8A7I5_PIPKU|nr:hypothetical protein mPipKuh1_008899 [Pipistrellus kuhlii]
MNIRVHISFLTDVSSFLGYIPRSEITVSNRSCIFSFFEETANCSPQSCTSLHSHQQYTRVPFSPHPHQHLSFADLLIIGILTGVRWYHIVVLICIFWIIRDFGHVSLGLLSSFEKILFRSVAHFFIGSFIFLSLSCVSCL